MRAVHRRRVGARAFPFVFVDVDPAALEARAETLLVVLTERRDRLHDPREHVFVLDTSCRTKGAGWRSRRPDRSAA